MRNKIFTKLLCFTLAAAIQFGPISAIPVSAKTTETQKPKYIFYMIGDGMGTNIRQVTELYQQHVSGTNEKLSMNQLPITGLVRTSCKDSLITDSAAAGTALATGHKSLTDVVSMASDKVTPYKTLLEAAEEKGMATGLITTVTITHATPATFASHAASRSDQAGIAEQYLTKNLEYLAGGGLEYLIPQSMDGSKRKDDKNIVRSFRNQGYTVCKTLNDFNTTDFKNVKKAIGVYSMDYFPDEITQKNTERTTPELADLLSAGIDVLSHDKDGFFVMCEGGMIDEAAHNNDTAAVIQETLAFDKAVGVAYDFYLKHPKETMIIVVADHDTGGISLGFGGDYSINFDAIDKITSSVKEDINYQYYANPSAETMINAIQNSWHLTLTDSQKAEVSQRMDASSQVAYDSIVSYYPPGTSQDVLKQAAQGYMFSFTGWSIAPLLSYSTHISWASQAHTGATVELTAIGIDSKYVGGYLDNTNVAKGIAKAAGLSLD